MNLVIDELLSEESVSAHYEVGTSCSLEDYLAQPDHSMDARIARAREQLGATTLVLGHHYQRDEVIRFADATGDSYKLSRITADSDAKYIVFCGVHFMAESADVLGKPDQQVILPDLNAGCSMADMAEISQVEACWRALEAAGVAEDTIPLTYMNSTAAIKAFCGERGGLVCTSSNARAAFEWAFARKKRILFLPDQHLGRNTGCAMGISLNDMTVWDPWAVQLGGDFGGSTKAALEKSKILLWKGHCAVHQRFLPSHVDQLRAKYPGFACDCASRMPLGGLPEGPTLLGSTEGIIKLSLKNLLWARRLAIGTEVHLVNRLAKEYASAREEGLSRSMTLAASARRCLRISPQHLAWALENLVEGRVVNRDPGKARSEKVGKGCAGSNAGSVRKTGTKPPQQASALVGDPSGFRATPASKCACRGPQQVEE